MLSEVYTPEDLQPSTTGTIQRSMSGGPERNIFSAIGSSLVTPQEEIEPVLIIELMGTTHIDDAMDSRVSPGPALDGPESSGSKSRRSDVFSESDRPTFFRTSTSGTQIFRPGSDGVELNGLPVGPSKDRWSWTKGSKRKERTYL